MHKHVHAFSVMVLRHWRRNIHGSVYALDEYITKITRHLSSPCLTSSCITHTTTTHTNLHAISLSLRGFSIYFKKARHREDSHWQECSAVRNSVYMCVEVGGWILWGCLVVYNYFWFQVCLFCLILLGSIVCQLRKKPKTWRVFSNGVAVNDLIKDIKKMTSNVALVFLITAVLPPKKNKRKINTFLKPSGRLSRHHLEWSTKENVLADYTAS